MAMDLKRGALNSAALMRAAPLAFCSPFRCSPPPAAADRFALTYDGCGLGFVPLGGMTRRCRSSPTDSYDITRDVALARSAQSVRAHQHRGDVVRADRRRRRALAHATISITTTAASTASSRMRAGDDGAITRRRSRRTTASGAIRRRAKNNAAARAIRSRPWWRWRSMSASSRRCSGVYPTFDGRFHYLLELARRRHRRVRRRRLRRRSAEVRARLHRRRRLRAARRADGGAFRMAKCGSR